MPSRREPQHVVVVDNYDSFTFNLVHYLRSLGARCTVVQNDALGIADLVGLPAAGVLLSPGPSNPERSGLTLEAPRALAGVRPVLGVCLGHQAIAVAFGGQVVRAARPVHGKASPIHHDGTALFRGLPSPFEAARYHSLVVDADSLPACLRVTARSAEGEIMGVAHVDFEIQGVQFHPESIATPRGLALLDNWLQSL